MNLQLQVPDKEIRVEKVHATFYAKIKFKLAQQMMASTTMILALQKLESMTLILAQVY
jgi:hypothetical protein